MCKAGLVGAAEIESRVRLAAEAALAENGYVAPIDVLVRMCWLDPVRLDEWRQGRLAVLERGVQANLHKLSTAMSVFRRWARGPRPAAQRGRLRRQDPDRRRLQFSVSGNPAIERAFRTHWVSPALGGRALQPAPQALRAAGHPRRRDRPRPG